MGDEDFYMMIWVMVGDRNLVIEICDWILELGLGFGFKIKYILVIQN